MIQETTVREMARLTPAVYADLEKKVLQVNVPRTELEAGFMLGVQSVLKMLREGYTVG